MPNDTTMLTLRVPRALKDELQKLAAKHRRSRSQVARFALEEYVDRSASQ